VATILARPQASWADHTATAESPQVNVHPPRSATAQRLWQADTTHWHLADGSDVEILNCIDDHSPRPLIADAFVTVKAADVV
jgi:hypothetical protein